MEQRTATDQSPPDQTGRDETARLVALGLDGDAARRHRRVPAPEITKGKPVHPHDQLDLVLPALLRISGNVRPDQLGDPTPCASFAVRDVFTHMVGGAAFFAPQFRGDPPPAPPAPGTDLVGDDPPATLAAVIHDLDAATRSPGALERTIASPFGDVTGEFAARYLAFDGTVHTWDFAWATGQAFDPPEELLVELLAFARQVIQPPLRDGDTFAAETTPPTGASTLEQLVAFTGRSL